ncbi:competence type IV pilus ATPase ComGA [Fructilactobacillus lindneri]|uniref:Competence protein ComGA n=1 Tax=Fructilactobacillus lindneri TaxID=53444 RepID=A0AB33BQL2_9LACO|nr:competence type IV pilus ATPase ComGA [Fructilactobacillus lindneri]ANZ58316.1 competence protein ComGA [Fructilactobacillus lindneri]ANZ59638.1 competence protein ComGA [Fructilactobacillus lindneri]POH03966.1 competence protein ComGA [Fructilactobacillus lindneri]POH04792.1 competence protein ComGA [Fructilactobacillus lindneri]
MEISELFDEIIDLAIQKKASDIYFLPKSDNYEIKIHTSNGVIQLSELPFEKAQRVITYCKYRSGMAISEKRRPQLGAIMYTYQKQKLRFRLSSVGNFNQHESLVLRIIYDNEQSGCRFFNERKVEQLLNIANKRGLMLFAGPTGSGKTTTIYKIARTLHENEVVMAIEDPVEICEDRFLQLEVNDKADMTYANLLKVGLRQRPDVFIIGEIRDSKTANIAVRAALSGHLVFSTVHAKTPQGTIQRLLDLGVDKIQLKSALTSVSYQRLLPTNNNSVKALITICDDNPVDLNTDDMDDWKQKLEDLFQNGEITNETKKKYWYG